MEMKDKIWRAARMIGYTPNHFARQLRVGLEAPSRAQYTIAVVLGRVQQTQNDHFFRTLSHAIGTETLRCGAKLGTEMTTQEALSLPAQADGIVVLGRCAQATLEQLHQIYEHIICVGLNPFSAQYDQVICDGHNAAITAMNHLLLHGHTRIGYVGECYEESRFRGYQQALTLANQPVDRSIIFATPQTEAGGRRAAAKFLALKERPTALFCANDITAIGVVRGFQNLPQEQFPALISIDDIEVAKTIRPSLTTIHIPKEEMGRVAANFLLDRMRGGHTEAVCIEFPCRTVRRESG